MTTEVAAALGALVTLSLILIFTRRKAVSIGQDDATDGQSGRSESENTFTPGAMYRGSSNMNPESVFAEGMRSAGNPYGATRPLGPLQWIETSGNPYGIRALDCRSLTHDTVALTGNTQIAAKFTELRNSDGEQHRSSVPLEPVQADSLLTYPVLGGVNDGHLFVAHEMEDKWDIYLFDGYLYFARSWTDELIFRDKIALCNTETRISCIDAKSETVDGDASLAVRRVDCLVKSHLFRQEVPHPLPVDFPDDPQEIARYSFLLYGSWASYAAYEDTIKIRREGMR